MSRPFSYNDENFNVIGNLVIIHCLISGNSYSEGGCYLYRSTSNL